MYTTAYWTGAIIGGLIFFPLVAQIPLFFMRRWNSSVAKFAVAMVIVYVAAVVVRAWGAADSDRAIMGFAEIMAKHADPIVDLPAAILVTAFMILRAKGKAATADAS